MRRLMVILTCALFCLSGSRFAWGGSVDLLNLLDYEPTERDQANCGNCWVWAGTGVMEIARAAQSVGKDRLSIQFLDSCKTDRFACNGGNADVFAAWYAGKGYAVPWSNNNAAFQDQDGESAGGPAISCNSIQQSPNYPIGGVHFTVIPTRDVGEAMAIANIKQVLNSNRAVFMAFYLPNDDFWYGPNGITTWFNGTSESAIWNPDFACGTPWNNGGGHAVVIVGYNDDDPDPARHYWIVLNSWGTANGRRPNGIYRMAMHVNYDCTYPSQTDFAALVFTDFSYGFPGGATCTYALSSSSQSFGPGSGSGGVNVTTPAACNWTVAGVPSWITVTSGSSHTGSGTLTYSVAANSGLQAREAHLSIAGKSFTVTQEGASTLPASILPNGDFESELPAWVEDSSGGYAIRTNYDLYAHSGAWFAWLGGFDDGSEMIYRDVTIPSTATSVFADFYYQVATDEVLTTPYDKMIFAVLDPVNNNLLRSYGEFSNLSESSDWMKSSRFDLSEFKGRRVRIVFLATTDYSSPTSFFVDDVTLSASYPQASNLTPFQPTGWSDKITVSETSGSRIDSNTLQAGEPLYVNWAVLNNGGVATPSGFSTALYLDNVLQQGLTLDPLAVNSYIGYTDYPLGALGAGTHTLRIVADSAGNVTESNEADNSYTKTIVVAAAQQYSVSGTVHSGSAAGPGIMGAVVTLGSRTATTNTSGLFSISGIPPGNYPLTIAATGYASYNNPSYPVTSNLSNLHFALAPAASPVRVEGGTQQYATLQSALNGVASGAVILARGQVFAENLLLSQAKSVTIKGGYDATFAARPGYTTVGGTLKIRNGRLVADRLKVR